MHNTNQQNYPNITVDSWPKKIENVEKYDFISDETIDDDILDTECEIKMIRLRMNVALNVHFLIEFYESEIQKRKDFIDFLKRLKDARKKISQDK